MIAGGVAAAAILQNAGGALGDMYPGSAFLQNLNSANEIFGRAGVVGHADRRWSFIRYFAQSMIGSNWKNGAYGPYPETTEPCNPEDSCGERAAVQTAEATYDALVIAAIVDPIISIFWPPAWALEPYLIEAIVAMDAADALWNLVVDFPGDGTSDSLVSGSSQSYPGGATEYIIEHADSHSGALRSQLDHTVLDTVLANQFFVPTQASCPFATSPTSLSPSALATSESFSIVTSGGCLWSAVSDSPWLRISAGINGNSSGAVGYSVLANPTIYPRQGTIHAGNGPSSAYFTVFQAGECTYTFSPGYEIAVPPAGENVNVAVTTQINCPWSVESNSSWLFITSGFTGTGSGSFTFTAASNPTNADRNGLITLMGQTLGTSLIVLDGTAAGTPGSATVTISGSEGFSIHNDCHPPNDPCPQKYYESGNVSITVAGLTFTKSYSSGTDTSSAIASVLASGMNYPMSPLIATVSGSTITIRSAINGAAANYPLVVAESFSPYCSDRMSCFTSPSFTPTASGSQLAGGTDSANNVVANQRSGECGFAEPGHRGGLVRQLRMRGNGQNHL